MPISSAGQPEPRPNALSDSRRVARNVAVIGSLVIAAKLFAALREVVIAWRYGVSQVVDAFQISFMVVTWAPMLLTSIIITALVPQLVRSRQDAAGHGGFVAELNGAIMVLALIIGALTLGLGPPVAGQIASPLSGGTVAMARDFTAVLAPFAILLILSGYLGIRLQAAQKFSYTFLEAMPPLFLSFAVVLSAGLLVPPVTPFATASPLLFGLLVGGVVQLLLLVLLVRRDEGKIGGYRFGSTSPRWKAAHLAFGMIALGQFSNALSIPIDQILAAQSGEGAVATLGYSNRLIGLITGLCITIIGYSLLPVLSDVASRGNFAIGRRRTIQAATLFFALGAIAALIGWVAAPLFVKLLFERGAFTADETGMVAGIFRISLLQIPFFAAGIALMQWLSASNRHNLICVVMLVTACGKLGSALLLSDLFGLEGVAMSQVVMYVIFAAGMLLFVSRSQPIPPSAWPAA